MYTTLVKVLRNTHFAIRMDEKNQNITTKPTCSVEFILEYIGNRGVWHVQCERKQQATAENHVRLCLVLPSTPSIHFALSYSSTLAELRRAISVVCKTNRPTIPISTKYRTLLITLIRFSQTNKQTIAKKKSVKSPKWEEKCERKKNTARRLFRFTKYLKYYDKDFFFPSKFVVVSVLWLCVCVCLCATMNEYKKNRKFSAMSLKSNLKQ